MTMISGYLLAQAEAPPAGPSIMNTILFAAAIFAVLYFLIIRPQKKKEARRREMVAGVGKGEKVITIGGIHGEIIGVKEQTVILLVDPERGTTLKMNRSAIHRTLSEDDAAEQK